MTRAELEAQGKRLFARRADILARMQQLIRGPENENREQTPAERAEMQRLDAELCQLDAKLEAPANRVETAARGGRAYQDRMFDQPRTGEAPSGDVWVDAKSGKPVRVLAPSEKLSTGEDCGFGIADVLRGLTLGPKSEAEMRAMDGTSVGSGGATIPTILGTQLIDLLRAKSIAVSLGCRTIEMPNRLLNLARVVSDPVAGYRGEGDDVATADTTFDLVTLSAKNLSALVKITRELLEDGQDLEFQLRGLIARVVAAAVDRAIFAGSGGGSPDALEPLGILGQPNVNEITASGAVADYDDVIDALTEILTANGDMPDAMAMDPTTWGAFAKLKEATTNASLAAPPAVAALRKGVTTALSSGTSPATGNIVLGGFSEAMLGIRTQLEITLLKERYADKGTYAFWLWTRYDCAIARPKNLARIVTIG